MHILDLLRNFQLRDFYICLLLANVIVLGWKWRHLDLAFRPYFFLITLALVTQASKFYWNNFDLPQAQYLNLRVYNVGEFLFFGWYFLLLLKRRISLILVGGIFPACLLVQLVQFINNPASLNGAGRLNDALVGVLILVFSLAYFYQLIREDDMSSLAFHPDFWLSSMNLIYYSGISLVSVGLSYEVERGTDQSSIINDVSHYLNLLLYIGYLIIFLCFPRKKVLSTP